MKKLRFVAMARVSSREQEKEGWSLDHQEEELRRYADKHDGEIIQLYKVTETASKHEERKTFRAMIEFVEKHRGEVNAILVYKFDRAARNIFDYTEFERLEKEYGIPLVSITQKVENTPTGRMHRRMLANMAAFYAEQLGEDISHGMERRVSAGLFPYQAPYGYRNVRKDGRSIIEVDPINAPKVKHILTLLTDPHQSGRRNEHNLFWA
jgi:site-specific DNA recombinase